MLFYFHIHGAGGGGGAEYQQTVNLHLSSLHYTNNPGVEVGVHSYLGNTGKSVYF